MMYNVRRNRIDAFNIEWYEIEQRADLEGNAK